MRAQPDGTGTPTILQKARVWLASRILGAELWQWLRRRVPCSCRLNPPAGMA